jgi:hypothetical protein
VDVAFTNLSINGLPGLRWDFTTNPVGSGTPLEAVMSPLTDSGYTVTRHALAQNPNWWNLDPRIGVAYDPFANHKTSIRAGFGIFHEQVEARTYALGFETSPPSGFILDQPPAGGLPFPVIPNVSLTESLGISYERTTHAPYVMQYNLTLQREIFAHAIVSLGYIGSRGVHLFSIVNENLPIPSSAAQRPLASWCPAMPSGVPGSIGNPFTGLLTNPSFEVLNDAAPTSTSRYNALQASLNRQFGTMTVRMPHVHLAHAPRMIGRLPHHFQLLGDAVPVLGVDIAGKLIPSLRRDAAPAKSIFPPDLLHWYRVV